MAAVQNKRKRSSQDMGAARAAPGMSQQSGNVVLASTYIPEADDMENSIDFSSMVNNSQDVPDSGDVQHNTGHLQSHGQEGGQGNNASDTAAAAMAQFHTMTVPQSTESTFLNSAGEGGEGQPGSGEGGAAGQHRTSSFGAEFDSSAVHGSPNGEGSPTTGLGPNSKPAVGSDEWHKIRKDNHKEVERRRRETINEGINELAKIVPGCEKNKGSILARAVQFITQLKENETQNIEKWTLEKLLTEQAIAELSSSCDKLKAECSRAWMEVEQWKKAAQKAGVNSIEDQENGDGEGEEES